MHTTVISFLRLSLCALPFSIVAQPRLELQFPLACNLEKDCWTVNYVDVDPSPGVVKDFRCASRSYNNHKGTDFAILDWRSLEKGVAVLAAAEGQVLRTRDVVKDEVLSRQALQQVLKANRGCGNGVVIQHIDGWQTNYCHMKQGSIVVERGDQVRAGDKLGEVGHTGFVEFPHLHLGVIFKGKIIDPYTGKDNQQGCYSGGGPLWRADASMGYQQVSIYATGFKDGVPEFKQIQRDAASIAELESNIAALTFWAAMFGVVAGDDIRMTITGEQGAIFAQRKIIQEKDRARQFYFVGKRVRSKYLPPGTYTGAIKIKRHLTAGDVLVREASQELIVR